MWTKQLDKYTYEYSDKLFNILDFDMEIIYQSEKIRSGDADYYDDE
jgi:hypothetical protein